MEWVASTHALYRNTVYPALLPLMRTPQLSAADWTDTPADINGLVRFAGRPNLVSARVPSHSVFTLPDITRARAHQLPSTVGFLFRDADRRDNLTIYEIWLVFLPAYMVAALLTDVPVMRYGYRITIYSLLISNLSVVIPLKCQLLHAVRLIRKASARLLAFYEFPSHCNHAV